MSIIGDILGFILGLGWQLLLLFLALVIGWFIFFNLFKLTLWGLIIGGITWLIFDSFWIGFAIGIIFTIWLIKEDGFLNYMNPPKPKLKFDGGEDTEMPIPYHGGGGGGSTSSIGRSNYESTPYIPSYEQNRRESQMDELSGELHEMEYNLDEARFINSEAEDARQKFLEYKRESEEALDQAEMEKRAADDNMEMAERFGDSSYRVRAREYYNACDSYMREAQEKANKANYYYERYMQLKSEAEYRKNEVQRLKDNIQNRKYYNQ